MQRAPTDWDGEFEELLSWKDELLDNAEVCEELFASKHEALLAGFFIGERKRANAPTSHAPTVAVQTSHHSEPAERFARRSSL